MGKILVIPDVHGSKYWIESCKAISEFDRIIFLGDYVDSSYYENVSNDEMIRNFENIVDFKSHNPQKVILLLGNHDFGYLHFGYVASRFRIKIAFNIRRLIKDNLSLFQIAHIEGENYLFTHAGITNGWYARHARKLNQLGDRIDRQMNFALNSKYYKMFGEIGLLRNGNYKHGSPIWADIKETIYGDCLNNYIQIVGHNPVEEVSLKIFNNSAIIYCDCHKPYILEL